MKNNRKFLSPGALTAPIPPAMVTVGDFENANVLTIAWTGILATQPPKTYISVRPSRHSYGMLKENGEFVINLPSADLAREVDFVGIYTGAKMDKFEKCSLTKKPSEKVAPPTIAECPVALECRVTDVIPMGSHDVFIADIVGVSCHESIIDEKGRMCFDKANLLAYAHGEYYTLGDVVGRFGFSTDKKKDEKPKEAKKNSSVDKKSISATEKKASSTETDKKPFYKSAPKGKSKKRKPSDKNKGAPHGRKSGGKK